MLLCGFPHNHELFLPSVKKICFIVVENMRTGNVFQNFKNITNLLIKYILRTTGPRIIFIISILEKTNHLIFIRHIRNIVTIRTMFIQV